ncbi:MAG: methyl-accepting chemotaxis protein [Terriglobales bacterium]
MSKLSVKMQLSMAFGFLLLILAGVGAVAYNTIDRMNVLAGEFEHKSEALDLMLRAEAALGQQSAAVRGLLLLGRPAQLTQLQQARHDYKASMERLEPLLDSATGQKLFAEVRRSVGAYDAGIDNSLSLRQAGRKTRAGEALVSQPMDDVQTQLAKAMQGFIIHLERVREQASQAQLETASQSRTMILGLAVGGIAIGLLLAMLMAQSIGGRIPRLLRTMEEMAANNLGVADIEVNPHDELGQVGMALNRMKNNLREVIQTIAGTAGHVASASAEIAVSASQQSQGADTQKEQTAQLATAMQQVSATGLRVSENSNQAAEASRQAAETARHGGNIVQETVGKMRLIAESVDSTARKMVELGETSGQMGRIVAVIDGIAGQTNLLALNAAIEAARAGEQGRGFAVVADEVRKLAERTSTATKEIAQMIKNIQDETRAAVSAMQARSLQVEQGITSSAKAGEALKDVIQKAEEVGKMITHIASAATGQSAASKEVNQNMGEIARLVTGSAAGAQQSAKACQDLSALALDLQKMAENFKLGSGSELARGSARQLAGPLPAFAERTAGRPAPNQEAVVSKAYAASAR